MKLPLAIVCLLAVLAWIYLSVKDSQDSTKSKPKPVNHYETFVPHSNITELRKKMHKGSLYRIFNSSTRPEVVRFNPTVHSESVWEIPKILHFIWVGPLIKEKYVTSINLFAQHNPNYKVGLILTTCVCFLLCFWKLLTQVILWTEQKTIQNTTNKFNVGVEIRNVHEVIGKMVNPDIVFKLKNVGAVSDLMRYEVKAVLCCFVLTTPCLACLHVWRSLPGH